jgi:hypothetical protein
LSLFGRSLMRFLGDDGGDVSERVAAATLWAGLALF